LENSASHQAYPLVVDLDETLVRTDTLHEALIRVAVKQPLALSTLLRSLRKDKPAFKADVAGYQVMAAADLPMNKDVLHIVEKARADGRKTIITSASHDTQVKAVADYLDLFDDAFGTGSEAAGAQNLSGQNKAEFLVARYGEKQFDYIGDCAVDIPVWQVAATAYAVNPSTKLIAQAKAAGVTLVPIVSEADPTWKPYIKALRPHQWVKNILVFLPMLAAQQLDMFVLAFMAFVLFSMTASSVYIFNDLVDLPSDRAHPRKRNRPLAAGKLPLRDGVIIGVGLIVLSLFVYVLFMPPIFLAVLAFYFAVTVAYSFSLKRKLIVDVITLAGLYTLRIIAGGAATGIMPSPWLLAFSVFLFYSLATIKRQAELLDQMPNQNKAPPGRGYLPSDVSVMQMIAISSGQAAVLVFALYLYSPSVGELYAAPEVLWLICPVLLYWLSRIAVLTHRGFMDDDPIVFAAKDKISLLTAGVVVLIVFVAERGI